MLEEFYISKNKMACTKFEFIVFTFLETGIKNHRIIDWKRPLRS